MSPTGGALSFTTGVLAPALGAETTAVSLETSASSPSPGHPWGTPAAGQARTPGTPPRRGGSSVVGQDRNSTGQGMEKEVPSEASSLGTSQWMATMAPRPTHSSLSGATGGLLDPPGLLPRNSTTEVPTWPTPADGPMGQVVWHASLPTWDTPPAPLDPTQPQNTDPGPSGPPDLSSAPFPASLETPACGKCLKQCVLGTTWSA